MSFKKTWANNFEGIVTIYIWRFVTCSVICCCCFIYFDKSFIPYDTPILESVDGKINSEEWNRQPKYLQNERKVCIWSVDVSNDVLTLMKNCINFIRPHLNPCCDYILTCRNGKQILKLSNIFGKKIYIWYDIGRLLKQENQRAAIS